jgi:hypothetical protein
MLNWLIVYMPKKPKNQEEKTAQTKTENNDE